MLLLRACPKCHGTLVAGDSLPEYDDRGMRVGVSYEYGCLSCGYQRYVTEPLPFIRARASYEPHSGRPRRKRTSDAPQDMPL